MDHVQTVQRNLICMPLLFTPTIPPTAAQISVIANFDEPENPPAVPAKKYEARKIIRKMNNPQRTPISRPLCLRFRAAT